MNATAAEATRTDPQQEIVELRRQLAERDAELVAQTAALDEALAQQQATAEILQTINSSSADLGPVFETLLGAGARLCNAEQAVIALRDRQDGLYHYRASFGYERDFRDLLIGNPVAPGRTSLIGRTALEGRVVHIENAAADPEYKWAEALRLGRWHTGLGVPLLRHGAVIGTLALTRRRVERFTDEQIELVKTFADQAVIAIENARLLRELRESEERYGLVNTAVAEGIYEWDVVRNSLWVSSRLIEIFGLQNRDLTAADWNSLVHREDFGKYRRALRDCFKGLTSRLDCEYRVRHSDGQYRWIEDRGVPVRDESGRVQRFVGAVSDISARKAADEGLREALAQQTATTEVLQVINSSPGDLQPVFDAMLEKAMRLCGAAFGELHTYYGEHFHTAALCGVPAAYAPVREKISFTRGSGTGADWILEMKRPLHVLDAKDTENYRAGEPGRRALVDLGGARTALAVPLLKGDAVCGAIIVYRQEVRPFSDKETALLQNFAAQAVIAMENARLLGELRQRTGDLEESLAYQTATSEVLQVISRSAFDLDAVLQTVVSSAVRLCRGEYGVIFRKEQNDEYRFAAGFGNSTEYEESERQSVIRPGRGTIIGRAALEGRAVQILDAMSDPDYEGKDAARPLNARTMLGVPLLREGQVIGAFGLARNRVEAFSQREVALVTTFADQAAIAIENARLLGELRQRTHDLEESLEYQTATSDVLQVISRSTFDLQPVLDTLVETAARLCDADMALVFRPDGDSYRVQANHGFPAAFETFLRSHPLRIDRGSATGRAALERRAVHIADITTDPEYSLTESSSLAQVRTNLGIPLLREGEPIGVFTLSRHRVEPFTERQIELVRTFADQAVIAIENTRLLTELHESLEQQQAMAEVLSVINANPGNLQPVFDAVLQKAHALCGAAKGVMAIRDGGRFQAVATRGVSEDFSALIREPQGDPPGSPNHRLLHGEKLLHFADIGTLPGPIPQAAAKLEGVRTVLFVPLRNNATILGYITAYRQEIRLFSDREVALLESFAAQAVIAMDNARLLDEIRQRQAELRVTFDNMGDGVAMFDADMRLAAWNRNFQQILDLPDALLAERPIVAEFVRYLAEHGEFGAVDIEVEVRRLSERVGEQWSAERTRPDGRVIEVRNNPVPGGGFVLIYGDVTERRRAEEAVRAARDAAERALGELRATQQQLVVQQKMAALGQLTAGIAHEIKNPLNFVNNFAGLSNELLDELKEMAAPGIATLDEGIRADIDETIHMLSGNLDKIAEHGRRADNIVKSMLEHSRGSSGERQSVDLNALVEDALNLAYHGARAQDQNFNIALERDFAAGLAPVELVPQDVTRVFLNLFGNGFYAANKKARAADRSFRPLLRVATRDLGDIVEVRVRDNGTGIAPEIRDRLFQPFVTTKPTGEGTGLGLSISYDIVTQQHGGTIAVESAAGDFTEFIVRLPRTP